MIRRHPRSTRTDTLFPYTTLFRSTGLATRLEGAGIAAAVVGGVVEELDLRGALRAGCSWSNICAVNLGAQMFDQERSEEHTSELQSLMRISYAVFCLKKKNTNNHITQQR